MAEESVKKGAPKWVKVLSIVLASILFVIIVLIGTAAIVWRNEISTVANFKKVAARNDAHEDDARIGADEDAAKDYQWITNFILQPGYYADDSEKAGLDRYEAIRDQLMATEGVVADEDAAMDILASVGRRNWNNDDSNSITVHSVVYNLTKKTVTWVANEHYGEAAYTFRFSI